MTMQFNKSKFYWVNFVWFQGVWFLALAYTSQATYLLILSLIIHFLVSPTRTSDLANLLIISLLGCCADYLLTYSGIFTFTNDYFIPIWLILLWTHFAVALNHGMSWLTRFPSYAHILLGALFGTLSYYGGYKMGAVILYDNLQLSLFAVAVIWATLLPVYVLVASLNRRRFDEFSQKNTNEVRTDSCHH